MKNLAFECIKKFSPSQKREICKAFEKLKNMIAVEESYGVPFEKIFNNDAIKYDILGNGFYTFKAHGKDKSQLRILYKFVRYADKNYELEMHKVSIKRNNDKTYIKEFQEYVSCYA